MTELKSCPFCGFGPAVTIQNASFSGVEVLHWHGRHFVNCGTCSAEGSKEADKASAIAAWNRRASQAAPAHEDDLAVDRFAAVMKAKLAKKRDDGRGGWSGPECSEETLSRMLRDHVVKGDPVDVANFAMMLHQRGERIAQAAPAPSDDACPCCGRTGRYGDACVRAINGDAPAPSDGLREAWHKTTDGLPKKPGLKSYEQIECLIKLPNGDLEISMWNCEHEVWDDAEGDDYRHDPCKPTHWMDLAPFRAALSASPAQEGEPRHD